jgi:hypothetical protein
VLGHLRFRVISDRVGSGIRSSSIGSFRVSGRIRSGRVGYRVISDFGSYQIGSGRVKYRIVKYQIILGHESYQIRTSRMNFSNRIEFYHLYRTPACAYADSALAKSTRDTAHLVMQSLKRAHLLYLA